LGHGGFPKNGVFRKGRTAQEQPKGLSSPPCAVASANATATDKKKNN